MSVTVEKVYQILKEKYDLSFVAGKDGFYNMVQWISVLDNNDIIPYMRATELAVTTGFTLKNEQDLLNLCIMLKERNVSGLIINVGPYIKKIPEHIITYCELNDFPLFSLPWEVRLIDIINETDQLMIYSSHLKENVAEIFKDYIFMGELKQERIDEMYKNGFGINEKYQMLVMEYVATQDKHTLDVPIENMRNDIEKKITFYNERFVMISHYDQLIILIIQKSETNLKKMMENIYDMLMQKYPSYQLYLIAGPKEMKFQEMRRYYKVLSNALRVAKQTKKNLLFYDECNVYQLLLPLAGEPILQEFYHSVFENLLEYPASSHFDTIEYLKKYVQLNGNIQEMAKEYYVHRNTITYNLKKIEKITGLDLDNWEDRLKLQVCLMIHDMI